MVEGLHVSVGVCRCIYACAIVFVRLLFCSFLRAFNSKCRWNLCTLISTAVMKETIWTPLSCKLHRFGIFLSKTWWKESFGCISSQSYTLHHNVTTYPMKIVTTYPMVVFLAHLSRRLKVSYCRPFLSVVRRSSSVNFLHFHLLLEYAWLDFIQTW